MVLVFILFALFLLKTYLCSFILKREGYAEELFGIVDGYCF